MNKIKPILVNLSRTLPALTFIFSGFVKTIDPSGSQYKIAEYLEAVQLSTYIPDWAQLILSVGLSAMEFTLGVMLPLAIRRRLASKTPLIIMVVITLMTPWLTVSNSIQDCGCFGDAIHLTNTQTFIKNLILLTAAIILTCWPLYQIHFVSKTNQWIALYFTIVFIATAPTLSLYHLPIFGFRLYYIGQNIKKGMKIPKGAKLTTCKTTFICEKNGITKEFTEDDYPYNDSTWVFKDIHQEILEKGYEPLIHDFSITDEKTGEDLIDSVLTKDGHTFLLVVPVSERADSSNFSEIDTVYEYTKENGYGFYGLTASTDKAVKYWRDITGAEYPFYTMDGTTLKTIIRSNPGLMLSYKGTIINKWSHNDLPEQAELNAPLSLIEIGREPENETQTKIVLVLICYIFSLTLLIVADRIWSWTRWVRKHEEWLRQEEQ